jgi:hypothetical protein
VLRPDAASIACENIDTWPSSQNWLLRAETRALLAEVEDEDPARCRRGHPRRNRAAPVDEPTYAGVPVLDATGVHVEAAIDWLVSA